MGPTEQSDASVPIQQIVLVLLLTFDTVYTFSLCGSALQLVDESGVSDNQTNPDITSCATNGGAGCAASGVHAAVLVLIVSYAIFDILALYFILRRGFQQLALCIVIFMAVTVPSFVKPASGAQGSGDLLGDALVYHLLALALTLCGSLWLARQQLAVDSSVDALMGTVTVQGAMSARYSSMPTARAAVCTAPNVSTRAYDSSGRHNSPKPRRPSSGDRSDAASVKVDRWNPANNPFRRSDGGGAFRRSSLREETGRGGGLGGSMRLVRPVQRRQNALQICVALFLLDLFGAALEIALAALPLIYPSLLTDAPDYYAPPLLDNDFPDDNAVALAATPPPVYLALVTLTFGLQPTAHGYDKTSRRRRRLARIFLSLLRFLPLLWAGCRPAAAAPAEAVLALRRTGRPLAVSTIVSLRRASLAAGKLALRDIARALQVGQYYHVPGVAAGEAKGSRPCSRRDAADGRRRHRLGLRSRDADLALAVAAAAAEALRPATDAEADGEQPAAARRRASEGRRRRSDVERGAFGAHVVVARLDQRRHGLGAQPPRARAHDAGLCAAPVHAHRARGRPAQLVAPAAAAAHRIDSKVRGAAQRHQSGDRDHVARVAYEDGAGGAHPRRPRDSQVVGPGARAHEKSDGDAAGAERRRGRLAAHTVRGVVRVGRLRASGAQGAPPTASPAQHAPPSLLLALPPSAAAAALVREMLRAIPALQLAPVAPPPLRPYRQGRAEKDEAARPPPPQLVAGEADRRWRPPTRRGFVPTTDAAAAHHPRASLRYRRSEARRRRSLRRAGALFAHVLHRTLALCRLRVRRWSLGRGCRPERSRLRLERILLDDEARSARGAAVLPQNEELAFQRGS